MIRRLVLGLVSAFAMPLLLTGATWTAVGTLEIEHTPPSASIDATQPEAPVADAAQRGDLDAVRRLLRAGADVNAGQGDGMTAEEEMEAVETGLLLRGVGDDEDKDYSGVPEVPVNGPSIYPIHAASGVGYGQSFAGNAHRYVPDNWLAAVKFLVEEAGVEVDVRDANAFTSLHHAASRGDTELVLYLVEHGADVTVLSRRGQTTADMANGPIQRVPVYPETVALLEKLGSLNNHKCVSCQ